VGVQQYVGTGLGYDAWTYLQLVMMVHGLATVVVYLSFEIAVVGIVVEAHQSEVLAPH
jgi:hypothetical protein